MRIIFLLLMALLFSPILGAQETVPEETREVLVSDSLYREDQLYFGATYNILINLPTDMSQYGFSAGFHFGFIRDFPINQKRDRAIGLGLGFSTNSFNNNLKISESLQQNQSLEIIADGGFTRNKMILQIIELPIEFRWRTSTPDINRFWRVYPGFKLGYVVASKSKFIGEEETINYNNIENLNRLQYGLTLSAGYASWNVHVYYALNPIFNSDENINGKTVDFKMMKIGLMFYML